MADPHRKGRPSASWLSPLLLPTSGLLAGIAIFLASRALGLSFAPLVGVAGAAAIAAFVRALRSSELAASTPTTSAASSWRALLMDAIVLTAFVAAADPAAKVWAPPDVWLDLFRLSAVGSATAVVVYLIAAMVTATGREGSLPPRMRWFLLVTPYLANLVLSLTSPVVRTAFAGFAPIAVLAVFNEVLVVGLGVTIDRRFTRDLRFHPTVNLRPQVLTPAQIEQFNRDGYIKGIRIFSDDEIAAIARDNDPRESARIADMLVRTACRIWGFVLDSRWR